MIVTIFDWDDTLMCTSHMIWENKMRDNLNGNEGNNGNEEGNRGNRGDTETVGNASYLQIASNICTLISTAKSYGTVFIVTNASIEWVYDCIFKTLTKDVEDVIRSVAIFSTVNSGISDKHDVPFRKTVAFAKLSGLFNVRNDTKHTLLCMGDCSYDRDASNNIREKIKDSTYVKNIKFASQPTLDMLISQQNICISMLPSLYSTQLHMDHFLNPVVPNIRDFINSDIIVSKNYIN